MKHDKRIKSMEYASILNAAGQEGWLADLIEAHATPCDVNQAHAILRTLPLPRRMPIRFGTRGRAFFHKETKRYRIALPSRPGGAWHLLRVGIVLHEAAHILDHLEYKRFNGHGPFYQGQLRDVLRTKWRDLMPTSSFREIFGRHRGPFSLMLTRNVVEGKKTIQKNDHIAGPFSAEEAHEEARMLVTDPRENVTSAFVYSETEGQFIGATYNRGAEVYRAWSEERDVALDEAPAAVIELSPADSKVFAAAIEHPAPPNEALKQAAAKQPKAERVPKAPVQQGPPRKASRALQVAAGAEEKWPKSEAAQEVLKVFKKTPMTAKDAAEKVQSKLVELGVAHPASLISRIKQAGLLEEVPE